MQMGSGMVASPATGLAANANSQHHKPLRPSDVPSTKTFRSASCFFKPIIGCLLLTSANKSRANGINRSQREVRQGKASAQLTPPNSHEPAHVKAPVSTHRVHTETHIASAHTPQAFENCVLLETQLPLRIANMPQIGKKQDECRK